MEARFLVFLFFSFVFLWMNSATAQMPGFVSLNCGGENFTDELGLQWTSDQLTYGETITISIANETRKQYLSLRYFPADDRKYCYLFNVETRRRYLLRATFLYGNFDNNNVYPKFDISLGATRWTTIVISEANRIEIRELIFLAIDPSISVCLSNATTGQPFISTLELRQFNGSVYFTPFENDYYLSVSARINFGAESEAPIRYPHDPFDRIWESDLVKKANFLVDVAWGTERVSTKIPIEVNHADERPPMKVMQTAVIGTNGSLTYRMNLDGFPGFGWAFTYFAEIEDFSSNETRRFRLILPGMPDVSNSAVNIQENALGKYRAYEPGFVNISLPFVLSFKFGKTGDSTLGPLLNAMEINKYVKKNDGCQDGSAIATLVLPYSSEDWANEGGDPCLPVRWSWVECNSDPQPRITKIKLSGKNLTGYIPRGLTLLSGLVELWLDGNSLTGPISDFTALANLKIIHLENNNLTGELPSSLANLPNLRELYVQNNMLSGKVSSRLLDKNIVLNYTGNVNLHKELKKNYKTLTIVTSVGGAVLLVSIVVLFFLLWRKQFRKNDRYGQGLPPQRLASYLGSNTAEAAHFYTYAELVEATTNFEKKIGSGGFGQVYYGKLRDGKEIAVKVLTSNSCQGRREFTNEVTLLSRIHHRNLVQFLGFCQEQDTNILVYEFMHNGTLKEHLYLPQSHCGSIKWIKRLQIAEDAAKGIEYLHNGCVPSIIHRDLKTSNILLDRNMRAKVSDFGLSKLAVEGVSHVSSMVRGTVGYLDPEYYISQQLTEKSDVYSFGVILLELISGKEAISGHSFGVNVRNIVQWARLHIDSGDLQGIIDPSFNGEYDMQSMWKIAEKALMCVQPHGDDRPTMSEVIKEIQDAILIERGADAVNERNSDEMSGYSSFNMVGSLEFGAGGEQFLNVEEAVSQPSAR